MLERSSQSPSLPHEREGLETLGHFDPRHRLTAVPLPSALSTAPAREAALAGTRAFLDRVRRGAPVDRDEACRVGLVIGYRHALLTHVACQRHDAAHGLLADLWRAPRSAGELHILRAMTCEARLTADASAAASAALGRRRQAIAASTVGAAAEA